MTRSLLLALLLSFAVPLSALANAGDDDDSAACDDDDSADTTPDDAATYGWLCGVAAPSAIPAPALLLGISLLLGVRRRRSHPSGAPEDTSRTRQA